MKKNTVSQKEVTRLKKYCRECGGEIVEKVMSPLYECERCIGMNEE